MKKNYYLTLDTETATLPFANEICKTTAQKKKIAITKPLVYDIGWVITDRNGNTIKQVNYLVQEIFFVPAVFNTAYYKNKRSFYIELLQQNKIQVEHWYNILDELEKDLSKITISTAYNACFDFKKAIPFTNKYIYHLYNADFAEWEEQQKEQCKNILNGNNTAENLDYLKSTFNLKGVEYPICDLWGIACKQLLNNSRYKNYCLKEKRITASGLYFSTSAETAFQYLTKNADFIENHTALSDAIIEAQILTKVLKKCSVKAEIEPFPFQQLGVTVDYITENTKNRKQAKVIADLLAMWLVQNGTNTAYGKRIEKLFKKVSDFT